MTKEEEILYIKPYKRGLAMMIDIFIATIIRVIFVQIIGVIFINEKIIKFQEEFAAEFQEPFSNANIDHITFLSNHDIVGVMGIFLIATILIGSAYHILLNCSKWSATVGKRVCNIVMVANDGKRLSFWQSFSHYFLSLVPWLFVIYIMIFASQNKLSIYDAVTKDLTNILFGILVAVWINSNSLLKKRSMIQDIIAGCSLVQGKIGKIFK